MSSFLEAVITGLLSRREKIEVEVWLPYDLTSMDMYKIFKDAAEEAGATLTSFEVVAKE